MKKYVNPTLEFVMLDSDEILCASGMSSSSSSAKQFGGSLPGDSHVDFKDLLAGEQPHLD